MLAVSYAKEIDDDLTEAARWYCEQRPDLGEDFLRDFQVTAGVIATVGQACRPVVQDYRRVHFKNYPYAVFFVVYGDRAVVYLVIHTSRDPALTARRLGERR
jgi:plasmid stabilization system protein ParE